MPGNPIDGLISRIKADSTASQELHGYFTKSFRRDQPLWRQYIDFCRGLLHGDLGPSIAYVGSTVSELIWAAIPYTLALLVPAIVLSYIAGNRVGAMAARRKVLDNTALPVAYILTATPYMWLAIVLVYFLSFKLGIFPVSGAYDFSLQPAWTLEFARSFISHWFLPFLTLFLVSFGGWAIGMRNLIIYELESEYTNYLQALAGAWRRGRWRPRYRDRLRLSRHRHADHHGAPEPRLLPHAGALPADHHGRPDRELHRRHRLRDRRPAHARRDPGVVTMETTDSRADLLATPELATTGLDASE